MSIDFFGFFYKDFLRNVFLTMCNMFTAFVYIISFSVLTCYLLLPLF